MFKNKNEDNTLNLCGKTVAILRKKCNLSQRALSEQLQLKGIDINKNAIQQIECGKRFVTDIELKAFSKFFNVTTDKLIDN
ncbi:MAG: helix-turn-helix transcriptional regulator [Bacillota bacterium]|nr:helix-turn-helix transcriptional regulator [Bacillota bacterium]